MLDSMPPTAGITRAQNPHARTQYFAKMFETATRRSNHRLPFAYLRDFA